jgi:YHS domain-containing protein
MAFAGVIFLSALQAWAGLVEPVSKTRQGVAAKGYDVVAYFKQAQPVMGSAQYSTSWMGATWWFSNAGNRDAFQTHPEQYAPQFGGYCAWAVSNGYTAEVDPEAWKIIDGKLYLNYSKDVQKKWAQDVQKRIADANRNWPGLHK